MKKTTYLHLISSLILLLFLNGTAMAQVNLLTEKAKISNLESEFITGNPVAIDYQKLLEKAKQATNEGNYEKAIGYYTKILPYLKKFHKEKVAGVHGIMAEIYLRTDQNELSLVSLYNVLNSFYCIHPDKHKEHTESAHNEVYVTMSNVYKNIKNYEKALEYCNKSILYFTTRKNYKWLAVAKGTKAGIYKTTGNMSPVIALMKEAYNDVVKVLPETTSGLNGEDLNVVDLTCRLAGNLAELFLDKGMPDSAAIYLGAVQHWIPLTLPYTQIWLNINSGRLYSRQKEWIEAEKQLLQAIQKADSLKFNTIKALGYYYLSEHYTQHRQLDKALASFEKYHQLRENTYKQTDVHRINRLELKYLSERKDREIAEKKLLIKSKELQLKEKNILLYTISGGCLLLLGISFTIYKTYRNRKLLHESSLRHIRQEQKITNLQSKVSGEEQERNRIAKELHDGTVSQLLSIKLHLDAISARNAEAATELRPVTNQVELTARELRQTAHNLMPSLLIDHGLVNAISFFCDKIQDSAGITVHFQALGEHIGMHTQEEELSLFRILQELIQNVLKHAQATRITVQLSQSADVLTLTVEDNGAGFRPSGIENLPPKGVGLKNIEERVQLLGGFFDIRSLSGGGTTAYVELRKAETR